MTTPTRCDTGVYQFLVQEAIPDVVMSLDIGYLSIELGPSGPRSAGTKTLHNRQKHIGLQYLYDSFVKQTRV